MNKHQFMSNLQNALSPLDPAAVTDIMADFEEHFAAGSGRGKTEEAIAAELGDPIEIGRQYVDAAADGKTDGNADRQAHARPFPPGQPLSNQRSTPAYTAQPARKVSESGLLGVILLNLFIGIPLWLGLFSALAGLWAGAGSIGAAAVVLFVVAVFQAGVISLILALFAVALTALTILAVILMVYLTKWLVLGLIAWVRWNKKLVYGGVAA
ncbi:MAG: DUF1700 domain-containing protein [Bacillota bacterium]|nr:DUF1700 domain-containing protein [Bacillota bacterium]